MRIISGKYKGRHIELPDNIRARPTTDFAREGLFDILSNRVDFEKIEVLDLFSGTGSISFEFVSRGTRMVHLVESDRYNISFIRKNIKTLKIENIKPLRLDVRNFLRICKHKYDIVFADPPYDLPWLRELPDMVLKSNILTEEGFLIIEHPGGVRFFDHPFFFEHRKYGRVNFSFFRKPAMAIRE